MDRQQVEEAVCEIAEATARSMSLTLVDVSCRGTRAGWVLDICLDRGGMLTLDDCAEFSRALGDALDDEVILDRSYRLEVCSPGVNRVLKSEREYAVFAGRQVEVTLAEPQQGGSDFTGVLLGIRDGLLVLESEQGLELAFPLEGVVRTRLHSGL